MQSKFGMQFTLPDEPHSEHATDNAVLVNSQDGATFLALLRMFVHVVLRSKVTVAYLILPFICMKPGYNIRKLFEHPFRAEMQGNNFISRRRFPV